MPNLCVTYMKLNSTDANATRFADMFNNNIQETKTNPRTTTLRVPLPENYLNAENYTQGDTGWCLYSYTEPPLNYIESLSRTYQVDLEGYFHNPDDGVHGEYAFKPNTPPRVDYQTYTEDYE